MFKFKKYWTIAASAGLVLGLVGCGSTQPSSQPGGSTAKGDTSSQDVTLSWFMWSGSPEEVQAWQDLAADVTKKYPNIHIKFETATFANYWSKLQTEIASGTTQDIISLQSLRTQGYGSGFLSLDEYIKNDSSLNPSDFNKSIYESMKYDGHQIAFPYDFGPYVIYYNKDLFDKYKVPYPKEGWTWDEFLADAQKLSQGSDKGYVEDSVIDHFLPFILSDGGKYLDSSNKYSFNESKTVSTIQKLTDLVSKDHLTPPLVSTNDTNWAQEQWMAGNIGMQVNGPWQIINYKKNAKFKFGVAPIPAGSNGSVTVTAGSGFGISKMTKHPQEAYKAIAVLTSPESLTKLAEKGRAFPARDSARPTYYKTAPEGFEENLKYSIDHAVPYITTSTWQQANDTIYRGMVPIFNGQVPVKQGLDQIQQQLTNLQGQ